LKRYKILPESEGEGEGESSSHDRDFDLAKGSHQMVMTLQLSE